MWTIKEVASIALQATLMNCGFRVAIKTAKTNQPCYHVVLWDEIVPQSLHRTTYRKEQKTTNHKRHISPQGNKIRWVVVGGSHPALKV